MADKRLLSPFPVIGPLHSSPLLFPPSLSRLLYLINGTESTKTTALILMGRGANLNCTDSPLGCANIFAQRLSVLHARYCTLILSMQSLLIVEGSLKENHFPFVFSPNQPLGQLCQESEQLRKCLSHDVTFNVNIHH